MPKSGFPGWGALFLDIGRFVRNGRFPSAGRQRGTQGSEAARKSIGLRGGPARMGWAAAGRRNRKRGRRPPNSRKNVSDFGLQSKEKEECRGGHMGRCEGLPRSEFHVPKNADKNSRFWFPAENSDERRRFSPSIFSRPTRLTSSHPALFSRRQHRNYPERHSRASVPADGHGIFPSRWFTAVIGPFSDAQQNAVPNGRAPNRTGESEGRTGLFGNPLSRSN